MLTALSHSFIYVLDHDEAIDFYVGKLGLEVETDADLGPFRWLTVHVPGQSGSDICTPRPSTSRKNATVSGCPVVRVPTQTSPRIRMRGQSSTMTSTRPGHGASRPATGSASSSLGAS